MGLMVGDRFKEVEEIGNDFGGGCKLGRSEVVILRIFGFFFFSKIFWARSSVMRNLLLDRTEICDGEIE